jgi:hypothetical protein
MSTGGGNSTLAILAKQAANRARVAGNLGISKTPTAAPVKPNQPPQPAKTQGITEDEEMLTSVRLFLEQFSGPPSQ